MAAMLDGRNKEKHLHENRFHFPEERNCIVPAIQRTWLSCKPSIEHNRKTHWNRGVRRGQTIKNCLRSCQKKLSNYSKFREMCVNTQLDLSANMRSKRYK